MQKHRSSPNSKPSTVKWRWRSTSRRIFARSYVSARPTASMTGWRAPLPAGVAPLRRFATGLQADYEAVKAGLMLPWSTGPVEGQINCLKMLKRSRFGPAKLDLLSQRFLLAA
jgi:hypothetical protein